jgi:iron(III) transport system permease protein
MLSSPTQSRLRGTSPLSDKLSCRSVDWRLVVCGVIIFASVLPASWLVFSTFKSGSLFATLHGPFVPALKRSLLLLAGVGGVALVLGWPGGTLLGLARFPGHSLFLAALALPIFTPSSLWAIGVSAARPYVAYRHQWWFDGYTGALLTGLVQALPLVLFATMLLARAIPAAQIDAARLAGGARTLFKQCARFCFPMALAAALLGGLLALADPGPAQIMGYHGVATEIFVAFSARYDHALAARKALLMTLFLTPVVLTIAWLFAVRCQNHFFGRDLRERRDNPGRLLLFVSFLLCAVVLLFSLAPPVIGFIRPLKSPFTDSFQFAWTVLRQSALTTIAYSATAAMLATALGVVVTLIARTNQQSRFLLLVFCFLFLGLPTSMHALGFAGLATQLPDSFDLFTRRNLAPGLAFGLRFVPIPLLFCLHARSLLPESCDQSAALHGVPPLRYHWKVSLPHLWPAIAISFSVVALATAADVSSTLILLPPGASTFTTRIFGIIDSTSERTLSVLSLVYLSAGFLFLAVFAGLGAVAWRRIRT